MRTLVDGNLEAHEEDNRQWLDVGVIDGAQHKGAAKDGDGGSVTMWKKGQEQSSAKDALASHRCLMGIGPTQRMGTAS
jgi:hypothetical protein